MNMPKRYKIHLFQKDAKVPRTTRWRHQEQLNNAEAGQANRDEGAGSSAQESPEEDDNSTGSQIDTLLRIRSDSNSDSSQAQPSQSDVGSESEDSSVDQELPPQGSHSEQESSDSSSVHSSVGRQTPIDPDAGSSDQPSDDGGNAADHVQNAATVRGQMTEKYNLDDVMPPSQSGLTKFEILLLILQFSLRFSVPQNGVEALIELVNLCIGTEVIRATTHIFSKIFKTSLTTTVNFFCPDCFYFFGNREGDDDINCPNCAKTVPFKTSGRVKNFFLSFSIEDQIRLRLEKEGDAIINYRRTRFVSPNSISDVFDGELFADLVQKVNLTDTDITINFNTDGSQVFKSTSKSLWPIQCRINEVPPELRYGVDAMMLAGLWFSSLKMNTSAYFNPFMKEMKKLSEDGIRWYSREQNKFVTTRVFLLHNIVDSPAKAKVLNMKQYNGEYGCYLCLHPGNSFGDQKRYGLDEVYEQRTDQSVRADMLTAHETGQITNGVKGISALMALPYFSMTYATVIDYMHSHLLSVCKYLVSHLWMNSAQHQSDYYLSSGQVQDIDNRLNALKPPKDISRDVKPLSKYVEWKANEWRSWLFFYGPICLQGILPAPFFKNFCRLSSALYILNQSVINKTDLTFVEDCLNTFMSEYAELYTLEFMTSNFHVTTHLVKCVIMNGPLWAYSLFPYEGGNGHLVSLVHGSNGVPQQVNRLFATYFTLPVIIEEHPALNELVVNYCSTIMNFTRFKKSAKYSSVTIIGNTQRLLFRPTNEETALLNSEGIDADHYFEVKKVIYSGYLYISNPHSSPQKTDSFVQLTNTKFARLEKLFVTNTDTENVYAFIRLLNINPSAPFNFPGVNFRLHILSCDQYAYNELSIIQVTDIKEKCLCLMKDENVFVAKFPNKFEKD